MIFRYKKRIKNRLDIKLNNNLNEFYELFYNLENLKNNDNLGLYKFLSFLSNLFYIIRIFILVNSACALDLRLVITGIVCYLIPTAVSIYKLILKTRKKLKFL